MKYQVIDFTYESEFTDIKNKFKTMTSNPYGLIYTHCKRTPSRV